MARALANNTLGGWDWRRLRRILGERFRLPEQAPGFPFGENSSHARAVELASRSRVIVSMSFPESVGADSVLSREGDTQVRATAEAGKEGNLVDRVTGVG